MMAGEMWSHRTVSRYVCPPEKQQKVVRYVLCSQNWLLVVSFLIFSFFSVHADARSTHWTAACFGWVQTLVTAVVTVQDFLLY